jgi:hypothetical protein
MTMIRTWNGRELGFIYAVGLLSFHDARPRGVSEIHFQARDDWTSADMLRHLRYERGALTFDADYLRGRMMKTSLAIRRDGSFLLDNTNRGEAATRWITRLQGKKVHGGGVIDPRGQRHSDRQAEARAARRR